jgi:hypothetical protein
MPVIEVRIIRIIRIGRSHDETSFQRSASLRKVFCCLTKTLHSKLFKAELPRFAGQCEVNVVELKRAVDTGWRVRRSRSGKGARETC